MILDKKRLALFREMIAEIDKAYELMVEYDSRPHKYGEVTLYQAESYMLYYIGENPGITITDLAKRQRKTKSACSQLLSKLLEKGYVVQQRNEENRREYLLYLTELGETTHIAHKKVNETYIMRTLKMLDGFTDKQFKTYLKIQQRINESFLEDVTLDDDE